MALNFFDMNRAEISLFENYKSRGYDDLLTALIIADERIQKRILATNSEWTRRKLTEIKGHINDEIGNAYGGLFESMQDDSVSVAGVVMNAYSGTIAADLPKIVIDDLINSKRQIQGYGFKELFDISQDNHARQLRVLLSSGVAQGLTAEQIARDYGIKSNKLSKGQIKNNIYTTIAESRTEGRYEAYRELERRGTIKGYLYDSTLDNGTTIWCREHSDKKYFQPLSKIQHLMHTHFHERSVFRPITTLDQEGKTKPSQFGETTDDNYQTWYLEQSTSFHKSTLTNKRYNDFLQKKFKVKSINDINKAMNLETIEKEMQKFN